MTIITNKHILRIGVALAFVGCNTNEDVLKDDMGFVRLDFNSTPVTVEQSPTFTKAVDESDYSLYTVVITQGNDIKLKQIYNTITKDDLLFKAGSNYRAYAENCDEIKAENDNNSMGRPRYYGISDSFDIIKNKETPVAINCSMVNSKVSVTFDSSLSETFSDYKVTITNNGKRNVVFDSNSTLDSPVAYFNVSDDLDLTYVFDATLKTTQAKRRVEGVIKNNIPAKWIKVSIGITPSGGITVSNVSIDNSVNNNESDTVITPY